MVIFTLLFLLLPFLLLLLYFIVRPHPVSIPIKDRHVFITGGSIGIGLAIAEHAASEGSRRISLLARSLDKLKEAKQSIEKAYGKVKVSIFAADVRDYDAVRRAMEEAGPIDVLVVNHGVYVLQELENQELDTVKFMIDVNLMGSFNVIKAALPWMKDRNDKGPASIALMSSMAGLIGTYGYAAYSATKFGLRGLAEALQQELISDDIHLSLIFPPATYTPGLEEAKKTMSELSTIMAAESGTMKAEEIGKITIDGIKHGRFSNPCNFTGKMMAIAGAGLSPQRSFLMASIEVLFAGLFRFMALLAQLKLYVMIEKWHAQKKKKQ